MNSEKEIILHVLHLYFANNEIAELDHFYQFYLQNNILIYNTTHMTIDEMKQFLHIIDSITYNDNDNTFELKPEIENSKNKIQLLEYKNKINWSIVFSVRIISDNKDYKILYRELANVVHLEKTQWKEKMVVFQIQNCNVKLFSDYLEIRSILKNKEIYYDIIEYISHKCGNNQSMIDILCLFPQITDIFSVYTTLKTKFDSLYHAIFKIENIAFIQTPI